MVDFFACILPFVFLLVAVFHSSLDGHSWFLPISSQTFFYCSSLSCFYLQKSILQSFSQLEILGHSLRSSCVWDPVCWFFQSMDRACFLQFWPYAEFTYHFSWNSVDDRWLGISMFVRIEAARRAILSTLLMCFDCAHWWGLFPHLFIQFLWEVLGVFLSLFYVVGSWI